MNAPAVRALETRYQGRRFRSRLEARWAVWLDALGLRWEYEDNPLGLGRQGYLPDFWLPGLGCFAEIKPEGVPLDELLAVGVAECWGSPLLWISGSPWPGEYAVSIADFGGLKVVAGLQFALGRRDHGALWLADIEQVVSIPLPRRNQIDTDEWPLVDCHQLQAAYRRAVGYRFEPGARNE